MSSAFSLDNQVDLKSDKLPKVESLPDGNYSGWITSAGIKKLELTEGPRTIFEIVLKVNGTPHQLTYWLTSDGNMRRCLTSMKRIGFDVMQWGPNYGRPYTQELSTAGEQMIGCTLHFKKGTSGDYATIGLESLDESTKGQEPVSDADLPF